MPSLPLPLKANRENLIAYELSGVMDVFTGPSGEADRAQVVREHRALGLTIDPITLDDARSLEPGLGPLALAAAWLPEEGTVDPRLLMDAVIAATQLRGAELRFDSRVSALLCDAARAATGCSRRRGEDFCRACRGRRRLFFRWHSYTELG